MSKNTAWLSTNYGAWRTDDDGRRAASGGEGGTEFCSPKDSHAAGQGMSSARWIGRQNIPVRQSLNQGKTFLKYSVLSSVDLWIRKCVKSRPLLLRHDARFPSPSGADSQTSLPRNTYTLVPRRLLPTRTTVAASNRFLYGLNWQLTSITFFSSKVGITCGCT